MTTNGDCGQRTTPTAEDRYLPPTQYLIMDTLVARWRLGESHWTFPSTVRHHLRRLEEMGLVRTKGGITENTERAWLTSDGLIYGLGDEYEAPLTKAVQWFCGFSSRTLLRHFAEAERAHAPDNGAAGESATANSGSSDV